MDSDASRDAAVADLKSFRESKALKSEFNRALELLVPLNDLAQTDAGSAMGAAAAWLGIRLARVSPGEYAGIREMLIGLMDDTTRDERSDG